MVAARSRRLPAAAACAVLAGCSAVFAGTAAVAFGNGLSRGLCEPGPARTCPGPVTVWPGYLASGVLLASAAYGFSAYANCREELGSARSPDALEQALRRSEPAPAR